MRIDRVKIARTAAGESARAWSSALEALALGPGVMVLKHEGSSRVVRATLAGRDAVVKFRPTRALGDALKSLVGASRAHRHWNGAHWLGAHGLRTGAPLAMGKAYVDGVRGEVLVLAHVPGRTLLDELRAPNPERARLEAIADAVASVLVTLWRAGRYNRDGKPSNLIVTSDGAGAPEIAVIDCVAIRPVTAGTDELARMLASLVIEPIGCGCPPPAWARVRVVRECAGALAGSVKGGVTIDACRDAERQLWKMARRIVESHGDPTPRTIP